VELFVRQAPIELVTASCGLKRNATPAAGGRAYGTVRSLVSCDSGRPASDAAAAASLPLSHAPPSTPAPAAMPRLTLPGGGTGSGLQRITVRLLSRKACYGGAAGGQWPSSTLQHQQQMTSSLRLELSSESMLFFHVMMIIDEDSFAEIKVGVCRRVRGAAWRGAACLVWCCMPCRVLTLVPLLSPQETCGLNLAFTQLPGLLLQLCELLVRQPSTVLGRLVFRPDGSAALEVAQVCGPAARVLCLSGLRVAHTCTLTHSTLKPWTAQALGFKTNSLLVLPRFVPMCEAAVHAHVALRHVALRERCASVEAELAELKALVSVWRMAVVVVRRQAMHG
jgi:hypothetical protein